MLLSRKLPIAAAVLTIVSISAASIVSLQIASGALEAKTMEKLEAIADGRRNQLETFLANLQQDLTATSQNNLMRIALEGFKYDWGFLGEGAAEELKRRYVSENPFPAGERQNVLSGGKAVTIADSRSGASGPETAASVMFSSTVRSLKMPMSSGT